MRRRDLLYYLMPPLLFLAAMLQSTALVRLQIVDVKPDIVLLLIVTGTIIYGGRYGIAWAFFGGIALDLFSGGPLGASSLALMVAALIVSPGHQTVSRFHVLVPSLAALLATLVYGIAYLGILGIVDIITTLPFLQGYGLPRFGRPFWPTVQNVVVPTLVYNTVLMVLLTPLLNRVPERHDVDL